MEDTTSEAEERGRTIFETLIRDALKGPDHPESFWKPDGPSEDHRVFITRPKKQRVLLRISQDALEQAADDPASIPRLAREVVQQLRVSESGEGVGYVRGAWF